MLKKALWMVAGLVTAGTVVMLLKNRKDQDEDVIYVLDDEDDQQELYEKYPYIPKQHLLQMIMKTNQMNDLDETQTVLLEQQAHFQQESSAKEFLDAIVDLGYLLAKQEDQTLTITKKVVANKDVLLEETLMVSNLVYQHQGEYLGAQMI